MSKKPTEKFSFGGNFNAGTGAAGESSDAVKQQAWKPRGKAAPAQEEEESEEEDEDDEDEDGGDLADLPKEILARVTKIRNLHSDYEDIEKAYKEERIALEKKYLEKKATLIEQRRQIVSGEVDVPVEASEEAGEKGDETEEKSDIKGIPGFWLTCLTSHPSIGELITEEDIPAIEHLTDITCAYDDSFTSFTLTFHFSENEFFTNSTLVKQYTVSPDLLDEKAPSLSDTSCSEINWKAGKDLTVLETVKKQKAKSGKNKGQVKTVVTTSPKPSFFHYFGMPMTEEEEAEADEQEEEDDENPRVKLTMEEDYDIGHSIRTSLIPEAVLWYTGEAMEDEDEDEDDDEDVFEDAEDDDDEGEEDSDEDAAPRMKKGNKKGSKADSKLTFTPEGGFASTATGAPGDKPAECKQN